MTRRWGEDPAASASASLTTRLSIEELNYAGGNQLWVDQVAGSDLTGEAGNPHKPYATVQAAVTAYAASGGRAVIEIAPAIYAEDVIVPALADGSVLSLRGLGATVLSLTVTPSATPGNGAFVLIDHLTLGATGPATVAPLNILGDAGNIDVWTYEATIVPTAAGLDGIVVSGVGAGSTTLLMSGGTAGDTTQTIGSSSGLTMGKGGLYTSHTSFFGSGQSAIVFSGAANAKGLQGGRFAANGAGVDAITCSGTGTIVFDSAALEVEAAGTGDMIGGAGASTVVLGTVLFQRGGGTGQINIPNATLVHGMVEVDDGGSLSLTAAVVSLSQMYFESLGLGTPAMAGGEQLRVVGAGGIRYEDTNETAGHVLTSDADGVASWAAPAAGLDIVTPLLDSAAWQTTTEGAGAGFGKNDFGALAWQISMATVAAGDYLLWLTFSWSLAGANGQFLAQVDFDINTGTMDLKNTGPTGEGLWNMRGDPSPNTNASSAPLTAAAIPVSVIVPFTKAAQTNLEMYFGSTDGNVAGVSFIRGRILGPL